MTRRDQILLVAYGLGIAIFIAAVLVWSINAGVKAGGQLMP